MPVTVGALTAAMLAGTAGASHQPGHASDASWDCRASAARLALAGAPTAFEPVASNANESPCADGSSGSPTLALPPGPDPNVAATLPFARTEVLCAGDDPDPAVDPDDNDACDAGHRSFDQRISSEAGVANATIHLSDGSQSLDVTATVANSSARASCTQDNRPQLTSTSIVVGATVNGNAVSLPPDGEPSTVEVGPIKVIFNERVGSEGPVADASPGATLTRRAVHVIVPGASGNSEAVLGESTAGFTGDACPEGTLIVRAQTAPDEPQNATPFDFVPGGGLTGGGFTLADDGERRFEELTPGSYQVSQAAPPSPYLFGGVDCADPSGGSSADTASRTATAAVAAGETVTCTFVNASVTTVTGPGANPDEGGVLGVLVDSRKVPGRSPCKNRRFGQSFAIVGTKGRDRITGTNRSDSIFALAGNDRVSGGRGNDCQEGGSGRDFLDGSNGHDLLLGRAGRDLLSGGTGRDRLYGGSGRDSLSGGNQGDRMYGGSGRDRLAGGYGNDVIYGGSGNDGLHSGHGKNRLYGGPGNDIINAATRGVANYIDCGPGRDRLRINNNERRRHRNCEIVDVFERIKKDY